MKFKYLLYAALASTLTFAACGDDDPIPTPAPEKEPTVAVTAGKADVTELTFTVTPADAKECRYVCVENIDGFDAEKILAEGTAVAAAEATSVTVEGLAPETEYTILAAVRGGANNDKTALSQVLKMTTLAEPEPEPVKLTLVSADRTSGSDGNFFIRFKDADDKHIMEVDFYAAADACRNVYRLGRGPARSDRLSLFENPVRRAVCRRVDQVYGGYCRGGYRR